MWAAERVAAPRRRWARGGWTRSVPLRASTRCGPLARTPTAHRAVTVVRTPGSSWAARPDLAGIKFVAAASPPHGVPWRCIGGGVRHWSCTRALGGTLRRRMRRHHYRAPTMHRAWRQCHRSGRSSQHMIAVAPTPMPGRGRAREHGRTLPASPPRMCVGRVAQGLVVMWVLCDVPARPIGWFAGRRRGARAAGWWTLSGEHCVAATRAMSCGTSHPRTVVCCVQAWRVMACDTYSGWALGHGIGARLSGDMVDRGLSVGARTAPLNAAPVGGADGGDARGRLRSQKGGVVC